MLVVETPLGLGAMARARARGLTLSDFAGALGATRSELESLLTRGSAIDETVADRLASVLGESRRYWQELATQRQVPDDRQAVWLTALDRFDSKVLAALRQRGAITATKQNRGKLASELAAFFDAPPEQAAALVPASFRQSTAHPVSRDAVAAWLRMASQQVSLVTNATGVPRLDKAALKALLPGLVRVGDANPAAYLATVKESLAMVGVVLVVQSDIPGSRLSGASWPLGGDRGAVALTLRYRSDDQFWWTLFHECAHLLLDHGQVLDSIDEDTERSGREDDANALAKSLLLPAGWEKDFGRATTASVIAAAQRLQVPAGLLVGQLQRADRLNKTWLNGLKKKMPDPATLERSTVADPSDDPRWSDAIADLLR